MEDHKISVEFYSGINKVRIINGQPKIFLNRYTSLTAAIEEYSQARQVQNLLKKGFSESYLESTERVLLEELRTKARLSAASSYKFLGGRSLSVDGLALEQGFLDYRAEYQAFLNSRPPGYISEVNPREQYVLKYQLQQPVK